MVKFILNIFHCMACTVAIFLAITIEGCQGIATEESIVASGKIADGIYLNSKLDLRISLPVGWTPIPATVLASNKATGDSALAGKVEMVKDIRLFSLWSSSGGQLEMLCSKRENYPMDEETYAKEVHKVMIGLFQSEKISFVDNISNVSINGIPFVKSEITGFNPSGEGSLTSEMYFKFYKNFLITIQWTYKDPKDREVLYKCLNSLELNVDV